MLKIAFDPIYVQPLPENHRFPMEKYDLLFRQLMYEGLIDESNIVSPKEIDLRFVNQVHSLDYLDRLLNLELSPREQRISGFPHNLQLIKREQMIMEGTRMLAEWAVESKGIGLNIAGGTHHAFSNRGEGFCLLNDQAIAARFLLDKNLCKQILIIDLDVHQGNGTAEIFQHENRVFTLSVHGKNNYPFHKEQSDWDIELADFTDDKTYHALLDEILPSVFDRVQPDFVFYQCGVDVLESDKLGKLSLSLEGCKIRDEKVLSKCKEYNLPVVCSMGGGYSPSIAAIVDAHTNTFRVASHIYG